jgi:hypothetical protein
MKNKHSIILMAFFALLTLNVNAQGWIGDASTGSIYPVDAGLTLPTLKVGIGTNAPSEQFHTTAGVRFQGITQDDTRSRIMVQDNTGKIFWRDVSTIGGGGSGNFWSLTGNAPAAGSFLGTTNAVDLVFKSGNIQSGLLSANNTSFGKGAFNPLSSGGLNTAIGSNCLFSNTTGFANVAIGSEALYSNTTGHTNTVTGAVAMHSNISGYENIAYGTSSLYSNTSGNWNVAIGDFSMYSNTTGFVNIGIGTSCLYNNTAGISNIGIGYQSLMYNTTGNYNMAIGGGALYQNTTGYSNIGIGGSSLYNNLTGTYNLGICDGSLRNNTTGSYNYAIGWTAMGANTTGANNIALGWSALSENTTGDNNTAIGYNTARNITTGRANTIIGANLTLPATLSKTIILSDGDGVQRFYIDNTGHAGLATTTPTAALHVNCTGIPLTGASNVRFENLQTGGGNYLVIDANGYVKKSSTSVASKSQEEAIDALKDELSATRKELDDTKKALADLAADVRNLMKDKNAGSLSVTGTSDNSLVIIPNPFTGNAKVAYSIESFTGSAELNILTSGGALIKTYKIRNAKGEIEIGNVGESRQMLLFNITSNGRQIISKQATRM